MILFRRIVNYIDIGMSFMKLIIMVFFLDVFYLVLFIVVIVNILAGSKFDMYNIE